MFRRRPCMSCHVEMSIALLTAPNCLLPYWLLDTIALAQYNCFRLIRSMLESAFTNFVLLLLLLALVLMSSEILGTEILVGRAVPVLARLILGLRAVEGEAVPLAGVTGEAGVAAAAAPLGTIAPPSEDRFSATRRKCDKTRQQQEQAQKAISLQEFHLDG